MSGRVKNAWDFYRQQGGLCHYCQLPMTLDHDRPTSATRDHLQPRSRNGPTADFNLIGACRACNRAKGSLSYIDFLDWLADNPGWIRHSIALRRRMGMPLSAATVASALALPPRHAVLTLPSPKLQTPFTNDDADATYPQRANTSFSFA